jgi:hypothetical protein
MELLRAIAAAVMFASVGYLLYVTDGADTRLRAYDPVDEWIEIKEFGKWSK